MDRTTFHLGQTVQHVLRTHPSTHRAFRVLKTQCVGCALTRFCTLQDVADAYELKPEVLLEELASAAEESVISMRSKE